MDLAFSINKVLGIIQMTKYLVKKEPQVEDSRVRMIGGLNSKDKCIFSHLGPSPPVVASCPHGVGVYQSCHGATTLNTCTPFKPALVETNPTCICSVVACLGSKKSTVPLSDQPKY